MKTIALIASFLCSAAVCFGAGSVKDLNTPRNFPKMESKEQWEGRAGEIREHVLASCGLWPLPPSTPLNAKVFGKVDRDGYSIEKVYFETYPGFYLAGNFTGHVEKAEASFRRYEPARPLGKWPDGGRGQRQHCGPLHQFCAPGDHRIFLRYGWL